MFAASYIPRCHPRRQPPPLLLLFILLLIIFPTSLFIFPLLPPLPGGSETSPSIRTVREGAGERWRVESEIWSHGGYPGCANLTYRHPTSTSPPPANSTLLCWVLTSRDTLLTRAYPVHVTWARHCDITVYYSDAPAPDDVALPNDMQVVSLPSSLSWRRGSGGGGRSGLTERYVSTWRHVLATYKADWYLRADDDTYIWVDELRRFLTGKDPLAPEYYGHIYCEPYQQVLFNDGGSGYVMSEYNVHKLVEAYRLHPSCRPPGSGGDWKDAMCLREMGVYPAHTRDDLGRERFLPMTIKSHLLGVGYDGQHKYWEVNDNIKGPHCCSNELISVHSVSGGDMMALHFQQHKTELKSENWLKIPEETKESYEQMWYHYVRQD